MLSETQLFEKVSSYISDLRFDRQPKSLYEPIEYILSLGGKRIRPVLLLMAYNLYKEDVTEAMPQAVAIELYHNFTLLHDDLMDRADVRRNKPTVHKIWGDNTAILSGDAMLILSYHFLSQSHHGKQEEILRLFNEVSLEICEGQQFDLEFEKRLDVKEEEYIEMIRLKTAVLLGNSLKIGAILGGASKDDADYLYDFGIQIGIAFQLKDDFLDVYGDTEVFGKKIGGDILCNKKTYLLIKALEKADVSQKEQLAMWLGKEKFEPTEKIKSVIALYDQIGLQTVCREKMDYYYHQAIHSLSKVKLPESKKNELKQTAMRLMDREM